MLIVHTDCDVTKRGTNDSSCGLHIVTVAPEVCVTFSRICTVALVEPPPDVGSL